MENQPVLKICKKIDDCPKIKMLKDHDWACDYQFANVVEEICGVEISKSQVSELVTKIDEEQKKWRFRILVKIYIYLVVDARYEKVRENGCIVSKAFVTIIGITENGEREAIGCWVINSESFEEWNVTTQ